MLTSFKSWLICTMIMTGVPAKVLLVDSDPKSVKQRRLALAYLKIASFAVESVNRLSSESMWVVRQTFHRVARSFIVQMSRNIGLQSNICWRAPHANSDRQ
jgi:hypothetical protein